MKILTRSCQKTHEIIGSNGSKHFKKEIYYIFFFSFASSLLCALFRGVVCAVYILRARSPRINVSFHIFYVRNASAASPRRSKRDLLLFDPCLFPFPPFNNLEKSLTSPQPHHIIPSLHRPLFRINFDYRLNFLVRLFRLFIFRFSLTKLIHCAFEIASSLTRSSWPDEQPVAIDAVLIVLFSTSSIGLGYVRSRSIPVPMPAMLRSNYQIRVRTRSKPINGIHCIEYWICDLAIDLTWTWSRIFPLRFSTEIM